METDNDRETQLDTETARQRKTEWERACQQSNVTKAVVVSTVSDLFDRGKYLTRGEPR